MIHRQTCLSEFISKFSLIHKYITVYICQYNVLRIYIFFLLTFSDGHSILMSISHNSSMPFSTPSPSLPRSFLSSDLFLSFTNVAHYGRWSRGCQEKEEGRVKEEWRKRSAGEVNRYRRSRGSSVNLSASLPSKSTFFSWLLISVRLSVCVSLSASNLPPTVPRENFFGPPSKQPIALFRLWSAKYLPPSSGLMEIKKKRWDEVCPVYSEDFLWYHMGAFNGVSLPLHFD